MNLYNLGCVGELTVLFAVFTIPTVTFLAGAGVGTVSVLAISKGVTFICTHFALIYIWKNLHTLFKL